MTKKELCNTRITNPFSAAAACAVALVPHQTEAVDQLGHSRRVGADMKWPRLRYSFKSLLRASWFNGLNPLAMTVRTLRLVGAFQCQVTHVHSVSLPSSVKHVYGRYTVLGFVHSPNSVAKTDSTVAAAQTRRFL